MTSKQLVKTNDNGAFVALAGDANRALAGIRAVVESEGRISPRDLDRLRIPVGGVTSWQVATAHGEESRPALDLIVLGVKRARAYWAEAYSGGSEPPDCASEDGETGTGNPGGDCDSCPMNAFGSARPGQDGKPRNGKACREGRLVLALLPESQFPRLLVLPPTSLRAWRQYQLRLVGEGLTPQSVVTRATLVKAVFGGFSVAQAALAVGRILEPAEQVRVGEFARAMSGAMSGATLTREDVDG